MAGGKIKFTGNAMRLGELMALMDEFPRMFEIVEPKTDGGDMKWMSTAA